MTRELTDEQLVALWQQQSGDVVCNFARAVIAADRALRVPMTAQDRANALDAAVDEEDVEAADMWVFIEGIRAAERHHGIGEKA